MGIRSIIDYTCVCLAVLITIIYGYVLWMCYTRIGLYDIWKKLLRVKQCSPCAVRQKVYTTFAYYLCVIVYVTYILLSHKDVDRPLFIMQRDRPFMQE